MPCSGGDGLGRHSLHAHVGVAVCVRVNQQAQVCTPASTCSSGGVTVQGFESRRMPPVSGWWLRFVPSSLLPSAWSRTEAWKLPRPWEMRASGFAGSVQ